ncbi:MAG: hypothetical protein CMD43_03135 [Gammaproteobacteria bacterium]|nr:hypothetical protein [Gammaproteobacteria bacterium]|tara:strand:- start:3822 stop:4157 length:336 start_codon:yes stop_codon:yes gene_type:complete
MERQIVDIEYDDGHIRIAKIVEDLGTEYKVSLLEYYGYELWKFDDDDGECEIVSKDSVSGFYDTTLLETTGLYEKLENGFYTPVDLSDTEYVLPSDADDDSGSEVSLEDEF